MFPEWCKHSQHTAKSHTKTTQHDTNTDYTTAHSHRQRQALLHRPGPKRVERPAPTCGFDHAVRPQKTCQGLPHEQ